MSSWRVLGGEWSNAEGRLADAGRYESTGRRERDLRSGEIVYTSCGLLGNNDDTNRRLGRSNTFTSQHQPTNSYNSELPSRSTSVRRSNESYSRPRHSGRENPEFTSSSTRQRSPPTIRVRRPSTTSAHRNYAYSPSYPAQGLSYEDARGYIRSEPELNYSSVSSNPYHSSQGRPENSYNKEGPYSGYHGYHDAFGNYYNRWHPGGP